VIESNLVSKILKKNIIHNYNNFINKKNNIIIEKNMNKITVFKKKNYINCVKVSKLNNHFMYNFKIIRKEILIFLTNKVERKFV
jgi:hypothetical protein